MRLPEKVAADAPAWFAAAEAEAWAQGWNSAAHVVEWHDRGLLAPDADSERERRAALLEASAAHVTDPKVAAHLRADASWLRTSANGPSGTTEER